MQLLSFSMHCIPLGIMLSGSIHVVAVAACHLCMAGPCSLCVYISVPPSAEDAEVASMLLTLFSQYED